MSPDFHPATTGDYFMASLESMMQSSGQGRHFGVTVLRLKAAPDIAALSRAWEAIHREHNVIGARLHRRWRGWELGWQTSEQPASAPPIVDHKDRVLNDDIIRQRLSGFDGSNEIQTTLRLELFAEHHVLLTWRHGLLDGIGINLLIEQLGTGNIAPVEPVKPLTKVPALERLKIAKPAMIALKEMTCAGSQSAWDRQRPLGGKPGFRVIELSPSQSATAATSIRDQCGEFFHMPGFAAIAARALNLLHEIRQNPQASIHLQVPFQSKKRPAGAVFQNRMGTLLLPLESMELSSFASAVQHVLVVYKDSLKRGLPQASEALAALMMGVPVRLAMPFIRFQNEGEICSLFHSHTGTFMPGVETFAGAEVANVFSIPSVSTPPGFGLFFSDHRQALTITIAWRGDSLTEAEVEAVTDQVLRDLNVTREP